MFGRTLTAVQIAVFIALGGTVTVVFVLEFMRNLQASRLTEAVSGVNAIATGALAYAWQKPPSEAFPPSAPLTPAEVPRGNRVQAPSGTWDHLTWSALGFNQLPANQPPPPHYFCFAFDSQRSPARSTFVARAHGDLDGDGERSTFEVHGEATAEGARMLPGLYVDREVE